MRFEPMVVTPELAAQWLATSPGNRTLNQHSVNNYVTTMLDGKWSLTHQGIALDEEGRLLDGHHRLTAVRKAKIPVQMMVCFGASRGTFADLDGGDRRNLAYRCQIDRSVLDPIAYAARLVINQKPTPAQIKDLYATGLGWILEDLMHYCGRRAKTYSAAPVKLAAALTKLNHPDERVFASYRRLVTFDVDQMTASEKSFVRQVHSGAANAVDQLGLLARARRVFDPTRPETNRLTISDDYLMSAIDWVCDTLSPLLEKSA